MSRWSNFKHSEKNIIGKHIFGTECFLKKQTVSDEWRKQSFKKCSFYPEKTPLFLLYYLSMFKALWGAINAIENPMNAMISHTHRKKY